jgi:hypothetical protein
MDIPAVGVRAYVPDLGFFGTLSRRSILGIQQSAALALDDSTNYAVFGQQHLNNNTVVTTDTFTDSSGKIQVTPMDVRTVGIQQLTAMDIPQDVQATMFTNWITKLTPEARDQYAAAWLSTALKGTEQDKISFVNAMVFGLSIGVEQLGGTAAPTDIQRTMFHNWIFRLLPQQRTEYIQQWKQAQEAGPMQQERFLEGMIFALT